MYVYAHVHALHSCELEWKVANSVDECVHMSTFYAPQVILVQCNTLRGATQGNCRVDQRWMKDAASGRIVTTVESFLAK